MSSATMTSKGQITIPADVRAKFRLHAGTRVMFAENDRGELVLKPKTGDIRALRGIIKYDGPPVSIEDMHRAIEDEAAERDERSKR